MTEPTGTEPISGTVLPPTQTAPDPTAKPRRSLVSPAAVALALASPAVCACMLALARHWSEHGARHSIGDMVPLGLLTIIGLAVTAYASATEDALLVGTCGSLTAAAVAVGMMAYPTGLAEPLIVTVAGTVLGWILTRRVWRARATQHEAYAEREKDRTHEANITGMQAQTAIEVTALREQGATDREKLRQLGKTKRLEMSLDEAEYEALKLERDVRRRAAMTLSATAVAGLDGATGEHAASEHRPQIEPAPAGPYNDADALAVALGLIAEGVQ
ncbi:hypothetical protein KGQ20_15370 [Catenulispora sp. NF23]|uniref:hypothetical protein n=1 Tax=Catenulispora pinistramenti TaxID=2705254 RepID=UPI001BA9EC2F|nr:hypothetical protein [Catenulispora pinistramenti]MBS2534152.1 hypothetical protein [Catenulispora pinistramenti]